MLAALDRAYGDRVNDEECLETRLDDEQAAHTLEHAHG